MAQMTLSEELKWRGFVNQTTYKDISVLDGEPVTFYFGVDPSAVSMTIGNLASAMMTGHFINRGHKAYLLVGGATGMIGDPDGKSEARELKSLDEIATNKAGIAKQYELIFRGQEFKIVDNYDWFKDMNYLTFLRDVGKHVPLRQMVNREFVQSRMGEDGSGVNYAEFSYSLIQAYDFLYLHEKFGVSLQLCGADQWGNSIAGVDLIRRKTGNEAHVWSSPLIINKSTGVKFGKSEEGAVWLDAKLTSVYKFYQFWLNLDDEGVEDYLKIYTLLSKEEIEAVMAEFNDNKGGRAAQKKLAYEVTTIVHGKDQADKQLRIAKAMFGESNISDLDETEIATVREEVPHIEVDLNAPLIDVLVGSGLASSNSDARRLISSRAIYVNNQSFEKELLGPGDFNGGRLLLRRGKAHKDSVLVELKN